MFLRAIDRFFSHEASGGILLMVSALAAMIVANSGLAGFYEGTLSTKISVLWDGEGLSKPLILWINDGLMVKTGMARRAMGHTRHACLDHQHRQAEHTDLLAQDKTQGNAQGQGRHQIRKSHALENDTGIHKSKNRDDQIQNVRCQTMLQRVQWRLAPFILQRNAERGDNSGQCRMHTRFQNEIPHDCAQ